VLSLPAASAVTSPNPRCRPPPLAAPSRPYAGPDLIQPAAVRLAPHHPSTDRRSCSHSCTTAEISVLTSGCSLLSPPSGTQSQGAPSRFSLPASAPSPGLNRCVRGASAVVGGKQTHRRPTNAGGHMWPAALLPSLRSVPTPSLPFRLQSMHWPPQLAVRERRRPPPAGQRCKPHGGSPSFGVRPHARPSKSQNELTCRRRRCRAIGWHKN